MRRPGRVRAGVKFGSVLKLFSPCICDLCSTWLQSTLFDFINWKVLVRLLRYTSRSVARMQSFTTVITSWYLSLLRLPRIWLSLRIITHWLKWCCSSIDVEYSWAKGFFAFACKDYAWTGISFNLVEFTWNLLLVPLWSRSWQRQAITIANT